MFSSPIYGSYSIGKKTEAAGTVITKLIPPRANAFTRLTWLEVLTGAMAHTMTIMRPLNKTTLSAVAAGGQAVISLVADPGNYPTTIQTADNVIAANDYVVVELPDVTYHVGLVSSVATLDITLTANLPTGGAASGAKVWFFGIITDTNPNTAEAHAQYTLTANATNLFGNRAGESIVGFFETIKGLTALSMTGKEEPLVVHIGNATNASTIEGGQAVYTSK